MAETKGIDDHVQDILRAQDSLPSNMYDARRHLQDAYDNVAGGLESVWNHAHDARTVAEQALDRLERAYDILDVMFREKGAFKVEADATKLLAMEKWCRDSLTGDYTIFTVAEGEHVFIMPEIVDQTFFKLSWSE